MRYVLPLLLLAACATEPLAPNTSTKASALPELTVGQITETVTGTVHTYTWLEACDAAGCASQYQVVIAEYTQLPDFPDTVLVRTQTTTSVALTVEPVPEGHVYVIVHVAAKRHGVTGPETTAEFTAN